MSWYYEALQRAERNGPKPENADGEDFAGPDGDSFLAEIESMSSLSRKNGDKTPARGMKTAQSAATAQMQSAAAVATEEAPGSEVQIQAAAAVEEPVALPTDFPVETTHYRHVTIPAPKSSRLIFRTDMHGLAAEHFRMLRRRLTQEFPQGGVLMVTSPGVGDGKTLTSINLSSCLTELGEPTLLMEADVRRPTVGKVLSCRPESPGMEDVLSGTVRPEEAIYVVDELNFHAAMVANVPRDPSKLINAAGFGKFLGWARQRFRWIVLDAPPVLPAADVADLLPIVDGVLVVVRAEVTPKELSKRTFEILGKHVCGVIFNNATVGSNPYYRYLSGYYQGAPEGKK